MLLVVAALLSLYLTYVHFKLHRDPWWKSVCNVSDRFDCDAVLLSPLSTIAGVPLSVWSACLYLSLLGVLTFAPREQSRWLPRSPTIAVFAAAVLAAGVSVLFAMLSVTALGVLCVLCVTLCLVNVLVLAVSWRGVRETGESIVTALQAEWRHWARRGFRGLLIAATGLLLLLATRFLFASHTPSGSVLCGGVSAAVREAPTKAIELEVYSDFQCRHCRALDQDLRRLTVSRRVRVVQKHFPLDSSCNPSAKETVHPGSCTQARAAMCAEELGRGPEFREVVFTSTAREREPLTHLAAAVGLEPASFDRCLMADETFARLQTIIRGGVALGIEATPTIVVNGRKHIGKLSATDIDCLRAAGTRQSASPTP